MATFKIKGVFDNHTRSLEFARGTILDIKGVKISFERRFGVKNAILSYKYPDGRNQALYQDFHLQDAFKDAEKNGSKFLLLEIEAQQVHASYSSPSLHSVRSSVSPRKQTSPSPSRKFCEECGAPLSPTTKFCAECGHKTTQSQNPPPQTKGIGVQVLPTSGNNCAGCGNVATGSLVRALNRIWHKDCFACNNCQKVLDNVFIQGENGMPVCPNCYNSAHSKICVACNNPINSSYLTVEGRNYHKGCFVCGTCNSEFQGGYLMLEGKPTCMNCYNQR